MRMTDSKACSDGFFRVVAFITCWLLLSCAGAASAWSGSSDQEDQGRSSQDGLPEEDLQESASGDRLGAQAQALLSADLRLGPFWLQPRIGASSGWQSVPRAQTLSGEIDGDVTATARTGLGVVLEARDAHRIRADVGLNYVWFRDYEELSALNGNVSGSYSFSGNRTSFTLSNTYFNRERNRFTPVRSDEPLPDVLFEIDDNLRLKTNDLEAEVGFSLTDRIRLGVEAGRRQNRFEDNEDLARTSNGALNELGTTVDYAVTRNTTVGLAYEWQDRNTDSPDPGREFRRHSIGAQVEWDSSGPVSSGMNVYYTRLNPETSDSVGFRGLRLSGRVSVRPSEILLFNFSGSRDVFLSAWQDNVFAVRTGGAVTGRLAFTSSVFLELDGSYFLHDYPVVDVGGDAVIREDEWVTYGGTIDWTLAQSTGINFRLGYFERLTNITDSGTKGLVANGGLSFRY